MATLTHRRSITTLLVLALLGALVPGLQPAHADSGAESSFVSHINAERAAQGRSAVKVASDLVSVARRHSERMASSNNLHHNPNLGGDVSGWQKVGENVGRGPSVDAIHQGFMNSPSHRANILDSDWVEVGVGVVVRDGQMWVTEVFRLPQSTAPEPKPEPEPEPTSEPAPEPEPAPAPQPASASSSDATPAASEPEEHAAAEEAEEETGPRHEVVEPPVGMDRGLLTLARLEAHERGSTISLALD